MDNVMLNEQGMLVEHVSELRERLVELICRDAYREGEFTLSSGEKSNYYIDGKMITVSPEAAFLIGELIFHRTSEIRADAIGGLAIGAVSPVTSAVISYYHHGQPIEGFWCRDHAKSHGTKKIIEGHVPTDEQVIIVDDVVTSGCSVMKAIEAAEGVGATVVLVLSLVDRERGARKMFNERGYEYDSIFTTSDLRAHVAGRNTASDSHLERVDA